MALLLEPDANNDKLAELLTSHDLVDAYHKLVTKGYSRDLLSECSEHDVEDLCRDLEIKTLIDRLKFKRCLKEIGIPKQITTKSSVYTIITQNEQKCLNEINQKLKSLQNIISKSSTNHESDKLNEKTIKQNKELINCTFDSMINMMNNKRKEILIELDDSYNDKKTQNDELLHCHNDLKEIDRKCQSLLIPNKNNINFDQRYEAMMDMISEWKNKYKNVEQIYKININIGDMFNIRQNINNMIQISPETVNLMENINNYKEEKKSGINGLPYDEKEIDAIKIDEAQINERDKIKISDEIDVKNEELQYQHRPCRAWRYDDDQKKWRGRGKGQITVYYHQQKKLAKILFIDEKHEKTRLLQWIQGTNKAKFAEDTQDAVTWNGSDFTMNTADPLISEWKLRFENDISAAQQFINLFNSHIDPKQQQEQEQEQEQKEEEDEGEDDEDDEENKENDKNDEEQQKQKPFGWNYADNPFANNDKESSFANISWNFGAKDPFTIPMNDDNDDNDGDNQQKIENNKGEQVTFKPIVNLKAKNVSNGHENETLITSISFKVLYIFGRDVSNTLCWKQRANNSTIHFYQSIENKKIRIVARENETNKLRLNHYVPPSNNKIAKFHLKKNNVYTWNALDSSINAYHDVDDDDDDCKLSSFCIKFESKQNADSFYQQFNDAMSNNDKISNKDKSAKQEEKEKEKEKEGHKDKKDEWISFSFGGHNDGFSSVVPVEGFENVQWGQNKENDNAEFGNFGNSADFCFDKLISSKNKKEEKEKEKEKEKEEEEGIDCPICYENPMKNPLKTKCGHTFCAQCIKDSLKDNQKCPICRKQCFVKELYHDNDHDDDDDDDDKKQQDAIEQFSFLENTENAGNKPGFFTDNKDINFGEYMNNIKSFVTSTIDDDSKNNDNDNAVKLTFEPVVHLNEVDVESGHENDDILGCFKIIKVYRWGQDVSHEPCWKNRATNTSLIFYQDKESGKIRLVSRENITNKLRLNQWIPPSNISNIEKKTERQISWTAFDATIKEEDDDLNNGYCMFAAKFSDSNTAQKFLDLFASSSINNEGIIGISMEKMENKQDDDDEEEEEYKRRINEMDENDVKLDEYKTNALMIWDNNRWKEHASNGVIQLYQNRSDGVMTLIYKENKSNTLKLNHCVPSPQIANIKKKSNNQIQWASPDKIIKNEENDNNDDNDEPIMFNARFEDEQIAKNFYDYFQAASMNNNSIQINKQ